MSGIPIQKNDWQALNLRLDELSKGQTNLNDQVKSVQQAIQTVQGVTIGGVINFPPTVARYPNGNPSPKLGNAVHLDPAAKVIYQADPFFRNNVIGISGGQGQVVIAGGQALSISGLSPLSSVYLDFPYILSTILSYSAGTDTSYQIRYDSSNYAQSMSFPGIDSVVLTGFKFILAKVGSPTYNIYLELRSDDGTGKPSSTILATSEPFSSSELVTSLSDTLNYVLFIFGTPVLESTGTTYHVCLQADTTSVDSSNYVLVRGISTGTYTPGQRCYSNDADSWTVGTGTDLIFATCGYYLDGWTNPSGNLTVTHPLSGVNGIYSTGFVFWNIGHTGVDATVLNVNPVRKPIVTFLRDYSTTLAVTGTTHSIQKYANVDVYGADRILVIYRLKSTSAGVFANAIPIWNGIKGGTYSVKNPSLLNTKRSDCFSNSLAGQGTLSFEIWSSSGGQTATVGMVTVIGC